MKFVLIFVAVLIAVAAAQTNQESNPEKIIRSQVANEDNSKEALLNEKQKPRPLPPFFTGNDDSSQEGLLQFGKDFGKLAFQGLKELGKTVGRDLISKAVEVITDGLHLKPTKEVQDGLNSDPSTEGIFNATGILVLKKAQELALAEAPSVGPSHEGILSNLGPFYKIYEAERNFYYQYNQSFHSESPSHEGILGSLGGLALNGLGNLVGGQFGSFLNGAGNILGNIFFALPSQESLVSQEGIISKIGSGILTSSGKLVAKGAAKTAKTLLKGIFGPVGELLKSSLWLSRSNYNAYPDIQSPGKEALLQARAQIHSHPEAESCIDAAELNLTRIFDQYVKNGQGCVTTVYPHGKKIVAQVFDIVLDAVKRVEDAHREAGNCFDKEVFENKVTCLDQEVPAQIEEHKKKFLHYGQDLAEHVKNFSDLNTHFDVCLTKHLGDIRREVYNIVYYFHKCVAVHSNKRKHVLNKAPVISSQAKFASKKHIVYY